MTLTLRLSTLSILLFAGCGPTVEPPRPTDAGLTADSGSGARDTGSNSSDTGSTDTGSVQDAGNASADVMPAADAGLGEDAGTALDAGPQGPIPCGGPIEEACPNDMICVKNDGLCQGRPNGQFPTGTCQPVLAQCPVAAEADAVCGCGGATYASRCHAQLAGEDVAGPGVCQDQVGYNRCSGARRILLRHPGRSLRCGLFLPTESEHVHPRGEPGSGQPGLRLQRQRAPQLVQCPTSGSEHPQHGTLPLSQTGKR